MSFDLYFTDCFLMGQINNIPALVQMMAWRRPGDKSLTNDSELTDAYTRHSALMSWNVYIKME